MMERLDIVLVKRGFAESRIQAKRLIMAGAVKINNSSLLKPGQRILPDTEITVEQSPKYVSRGGLKLEKALDVFDLSVKNKVAIDIGASTGGFTDCLLQHDVKYVYAIDVGYGQLAWRLRKDPRVEVHERTNIRHIDQHLFHDTIDIAVIDVSFISLQKVLPVIIEKLGISEIVALVKPQFEAGRLHVKKGGIVDDPDVHEQTLTNLIHYVQNSFAYIHKGLTFSPVHKDIGNIEYLLWIQKPTSNEITNTDISNKVSDVVKTAHLTFYGDCIQNRN